ncbi:hypothetical protein MTR67_023267 [Solanum verrucosum]|uniref:Uncharacterized protein n=1 Tax=Solanum verrucosum TaxID=315347 RepID=A0AAF0QWG4_SOLVR|nr:hypothetical protein MTR67_023267 [Solanum verrucosum]
MNGPMHIEKHFVYISNPLLGEYFEVKFPEWEISVCRVTYGFCFSKASGKYNVLRFVVRKLTKVSELEVYTLGVCEKWRNRKNDIIYSFDIETEKVKSLPALPGLSNLLLLELKEEYDYYARRCHRPIHLTPKFHFPPGRVILVGSCKGFIFFLNGAAYIEKHFVYIESQ